MDVLNLLNFSDTIIGIATPRGKGAIGVVRLSGKDSINLVQQIFSKPILEAPGGTFYYGNLYDSQEKLDDVIVSIFRAPNSYTGENSVEISCHASSYILQRTVEILASLGARVAEKGEFTRRAFMNGKMDLLQAEAVADLIQAENKTQKDLAQRQKNGLLSQLLAKLEQNLIRLAALTETQLDFDEELDIQDIQDNQIVTEITQIITDIEKLLASFKQSQIFQDGVKITIAGSPNVGKSTLLNTILGQNRAIVSDIAGTTRDTIEARSYYQDLPLDWVDTAGLRNAHDDIERQGIERSYEQIKYADWVIFLFDVNCLNLCQLMEYEDLLNLWEKKFLLVANQIDRMRPQDLSKIKQQCSTLRKTPIFISAKQQSSVDSLLQELHRNILPNWSSYDSPILLKSRHVDLLNKILKNLQDLRSGIMQKIPYDLLNIEIKYALHYIAQLTGSHKDEQVLAYIFENFCIGK